MVVQGLAIGTAWSRRAQLNYDHNANIDVAPASDVCLSGRSMGLLLMKMFIASLMTETNSFAPLPTGRLAFEERGVFRGDASTKSERSAFGPVLKLWRTMAEQEDCEVAESVCAFAQPGGLVQSALYEEYREQILEDLRAALPVQIILVCLHGAMAAHGYDDCEGDLLARLRAVAGPDCIIGAVLDLHCHSTAEMFRSASVLVAYKEYPHTDVGQSSRELFSLCIRAARGEIRPTTRAFDCNMIGLWRTGPEPVRGFVEAMRECEASGEALSLSFGHGFPWADVEDVGAKVWAITDNDPAAADRLARSFGERAVAMRTAGRIPHKTIDEAIDALNHAPAGLVVFADMADNAGGGAPSDSTFILKRLIERGVESAACGAIWDMTSVEICRNAGVGSRLRLRIGGKVCPESGDPVDVEGIVRGLIDDHRPAGLRGNPTPVGASVWLDAGGIDVILCAMRSQTFGPAVFEDHGIRLSTKRVVVVKSIEHFYTAFAPISSEIIYVTTPGALRPDFESIPYTKRSLDYWPRFETAPTGPFEF